MPKAKGKIGKKTRKAINISEESVTDYINMLKRNKLSRNASGTRKQSKSENNSISWNETHGPETLFMGKVVGVRGDGRFMVSPITYTGPDILVHLSGALRIKKADTHKGLKVEVSNDDNVLVDGETITGVFSQAEAAQVRKYLNVRNSGNNIFNRSESEEDEEEEKKKKKKKTYRK
jgi:hypothetical protein